MTHRFVFTDELHASSLLCASSPANLPRSFDHQLAVIAYGATGTGKTHTMQGPHERTDHHQRSEIRSPSENPGLLLRIVEEVHQASADLDVASIHMTAVQYHLNVGKVCT